MKKIFLSLSFFPLFLLFVPLTYADHNVDFTVTQMDPQNSYTNGYYLITTDIPYADAPDHSSLGSCSLIDNSTNESVDDNENLYDTSSDGVFSITHISDSSAPTGWTSSSTYHLKCTTTDPNYPTSINSNDFHFIVNPTIVHVAQNFNLIDVYFLPQYDSYPNSSSNIALVADSGWFDNLGYGTCEGNVEYEGQNVSVCHFDLHVNPSLATTDTARFAIGGQTDDGVYYSMLSSTFHVDSIAPQVSSLSDATISVGGTYSATGSISNIDPTMTSISATAFYRDGSDIDQVPINPDDTFSFSHIFSTPGTYEISFCVTEILQNGVPSTGCAKPTITVTAPPQINSLNGGTINAGDTYSENGSFTDPDSSSWTANVDYGDGSGSQPLTLNSDNTFSLSHQYTTEGTYAVTVTITDNQGGTGTATATVTVNPAAPTTLSPTADTYIDGSKNTNEGGSPVLTVQNSGNKRALVQFDESQIEAAVGGVTNYTATLQFTITDSSNLGSTGRQIDIQRMLQPWAEGNGYVTGNPTPNRGTGSGVTWLCAVDTDISNTRTDCSGTTAWDMTNSSSYPFVSTPTANTTVVKNQTGTVSFDVTSDVQSFVNGTNSNDGWIVKLDNESQSGKVVFGSKESGNAPQLIITKN